MKSGKLDSILSMIHSGPGNVVDVPPPVAVAQVQVTAVRRHHRHHHQSQVLVHQGQVHSLGLVLHRGLGSHSRNEGRGNTWLHCSGGYVDNSGTFWACHQDLVLDKLRTLEAVNLNMFLKLGKIYRFSGSWGK